MKAQLVSLSRKLLDELNNENWEGSTVREIVGEMQSVLVDDECEAHADSLGTVDAESAENRKIRDAVLTQEWRIENDGKGGIITRYGIDFAEKLVDWGMENSFSEAMVKLHGSTIGDCIKTGVSAYVRTT